MLKNSLCAAVLCAFSLSLAGPVVGQSPETSVKVNNTAKPFKILTSGKKITIQSKQNISSVIVWTSGGHRLVEQKDINATSYSFNITVQEKIFFVRVDMGDGKMYSQKVGVQ
jgi:hypothetical protein